jgi:hypothetical protein
MIGSLHYVNGQDSSTKIFWFDKVLDHIFTSRALTNALKFSLHLIKCMLHYSHDTAKNTGIGGTSTS